MAFNIHKLYMKVNVIIYLFSLFRESSMHLHDIYM